VDGGVLHPVPTNRVFRHDGDMLVEISRYACIAFDFYKADELIHAGRITTKEAIKKLNKQESLS